LTIFQESIHQSQYPLEQIYLFIYFSVSNILLWVYLEATCHVLQPLLSSSWVIFMWRNRKWPLRVQN